MWPSHKIIFVNTWFLIIAILRNDNLQDRIAEHHSTEYHKLRNELKILLFSVIFLSIIIYQINIRPKLVLIYITFLVIQTYEYKRVCIFTYLSEFKTLFYL